jgi:hypothetical protein
LRGAEILIRVDDRQEMMGDALLLDRRWFGSSDVQIPVDLHGISVNNFHGELPGKRKCNVGFPDAGRALDDYYLLFFYEQLLML